MVDEDWGGAQHKSDFELERLQREGSYAAMEEIRRRNMRRAEEVQGGGSAPPPTGLGLGPVLVAAVVLGPFVALAYLVRLLASGTTALAQDSILSPLFPSPGASPGTFFARVLVLELLIPGLLLVSALAVRRTRAAVLGAVILPFAFLMVPVVAIVAASASTTYS